MTVIGVALSGTDAGNYTSASPAGLSANITAKNLTISGAVANNKQYDGNTTATVDFTSATLAVVVSGDSVSINSSGYSASFATKTVGTGKAVTVIGVALSGGDAGNYTVSQPSGLIADITAKNLTISGAVANNKQYDGNTTATVDFTSATLAVVVSGDCGEHQQLRLQCELCHEDCRQRQAGDSDRGDLSGGDAGNYTVSQPSGLSAEITARTDDQRRSSQHKQYDGNHELRRHEVRLYDYSRCESGDVVSIVPVDMASFATKTVNTG